MEMNVLIVTDTNDRSETLTGTLQRLGYADLAAVTTDDDWAGIVRDRNPSVLVFGVDQPHEQLVDDIARVNGDQPLPVAMFTETSDRTVMAAAIRAGVSAYSVKGFNESRIGPVIDLAMARFAEFQKLREELEKTKSTLEDRKTIDRAKGIVMQQRGCGEDEAYRLLQKMAMDRHKKMAEVAREVILVSEVLKAEN